MSPATRARLLVPEDDEAQVIATEFFRLRELDWPEDEALARALEIARDLGCFRKLVPR